MTRHPDVLILGGGVIGLTTAYYLAGEGIAVEIVERGDPGREASWAGAGIIPPGNPAGADSPYDSLRARSARRFPSLSAELREQTGMDNGYLVCGGLELVGPDTESCAQAWLREGIRVERLGPEQTRRLEPAISPTESFHLPDMAQVRNPRHLRALIAGCAARGVRIRSHTSVVGLDSRDGTVLAARISEGTLSAGRFLIAAGAWSRSLLEPFDVAPEIRPVRGQIVLLESQPPLVRHIVIDGSRYLVPRPDGRILVGSTEEEAGFDPSTTASAVADLIGLAIRLVPALASAKIERCWAGLRPGSADGLPYLGVVPGFDNLYLAAGHFRAGIQLSPATAEVMTNLILGRPPGLDLSPFRPDRPPAPRRPAVFRS